MHWDLESFNMPWAWHETIAGGGNVLLAVCLTACLSQALTNCVCLLFRGVPSELSQQLLKKNIFTALDGHIFCCSVTLLTSFLVLASSSQLPLSHPAAPPEHLKEPLAYMRKAQVSLSALISVTPHSFYLSDSFFRCWIQRRCFFFIFITRVWFCVCVLSYTGQLGEARPQKPEQHEHRARSASGSHGN